MAGEKVASDLRLVSVFTRLTSFLLLEQPASRNLALTLPMLRLLSSKPQGRKDFLKPSQPCHVGIHWIAFAEYFKMSAHVPGFQSLFQTFLHHFVLAKLATIGSIRVSMAKK